MPPKVVEAFYKREQAQDSEMEKFWLSMLKWEKPKEWVIMMQLQSLPPCMAALQDLNLSTSSLLPHLIWDLKAIGM